MILMNYDYSYHLQTGLLQSLYPQHRGYLGNKYLTKQKIAIRRQIMKKPSRTLGVKSTTEIKDLLEGSNSRFEQIEKGT